MPNALVAPAADLLAFAARGVDAGIAPPSPRAAAGGSGMRSFRFAHRDPSRRTLSESPTTVFATLLLLVAQRAAAATYSSPIAITPDDHFVWVVNPDNNSVSVLEVAGDINLKRAEIGVGVDPRSVA